MKKVFTVLLGVLIIVARVTLTVGVVSAIVWGVCAICGWAFAWKWVFIATIVSAIFCSRTRSVKA